MPLTSITLTQANVQNSNNPEENVSASDAKFENVASVFSFLMQD